MAPRGKVRFRRPDGLLTSYIPENLVKYYLVKGFELVDGDVDESDKREEAEAEEVKEFDLCSATTKSGAPCKARAINEGLCMRHYNLMKQSLVNEPDTE